MKKTSDPHEHDWQDHANLNAKCAACGQIQRWTAIVTELRQRAQSARRDALIEAAHDCLALAEDTGHASGWMKAANACAAAIGTRLMSRPFPPVETFRGLAVNRVRVFLAEAKRYAAAGEHGTGHDADELTITDVANGYREGYKHLHHLVSQVAPWLDRLLGERSTT